MRIQAVCPICQKKWQVSSVERAKELEAYLAQSAKYGVLYQEGQTAWLFGHAEVEVMEVHLDLCAYYKNDVYAHPIKYLIRRKNNGKELVVPWRQLLPEPIAKVPRQKRRNRTYEVTWRNYWEFFPDLVGYH